MTSRLLLLVRAEMRRLLTATTIALPFLLAILTGTFMLAASNRENILVVPSLLMNFVGGFVIVFGVPTLGVGMVAADVKDHWLRTLLMRPVSRTEYLLGRVTAVYAFVVVTMIFAGFAPMLILSSVLDKPLVWLVSRSVPAFVFLLAHAYLVVLLLTFLSCWLPGIVNIVMLALWAMSSSLISSYVRSAWWDNGVAVLGAEFLFPSGFLEAAELSAEHTGDPMGPALWGLAATVVFLALTIWSLNRMPVDGGSE